MQSNLTPKVNIAFDSISVYLMDVNYSRCSSDYGVVVTGHSLGSGIATVLGFLLRRKYPDTQVYAYAVVGGTLSPEAQKESEKFTYSVTAGDDVITRLSLISMQR